MVWIVINKCLWQFDQLWASSIGCHKEYIGSKIVVARGDRIDLYILYNFLRYIDLAISNPSNTSRIVGTENLQV